MKIVSGDWRRVLGPSTLGVDSHHGLTPTGVFLDPPYAFDVRSKIRLYAEDGATVSADARRWALKHGDDPRLRVVLAGYEGEHDMPGSWRCVAWKSQGASQNADKERLWLSPHCLGGTASEPLYHRADGGGS
jgi:DNA adenine methylase